MHQIIKCYGLSVLLLMPFGAEASHHCSQWLAKVISFQGKVDIQFPESTTWESVMQDQTFCHGDKIRTARNSRATLLFTNESRATLDQQSTLTLLAPEKKVSSWYLKLLQGTSFFRSRQSQRLNIDTPFVNAVHEGTEFLVTVNSYQTEITVFDGQVAASNQKGEIHIKKGYTGIAKKNQPPHIQALTIRPEDAVQWTLYYPPVIDYQDSELSKLDLLQPAIKAYQLGDTYQALTLLDEIPATQQNASYLTLKSSLLLTVGSVDEAIKLIEKTLSIDADNSSAFALKSIIAVTKNRQDEALNLAQKAVILNPQSAVAQIALSYAYQSQFKIESALKATKEATRLSPDNALAWARLSELQLSTGERSDALASAKKAQQLNPKLDRTQTILGFAYLAQVDIDEANTAFSEAINLNTADPLARLGLGLAKIRKGDIEEGTHDLETAVSLDPDNAIMRSYLGKAYYELKNDEFAGTELAIAKEKDPNDPTAWFYDAIRKQTTNRPVEALHDMQKAIELNDNRGVYRSKLLLDEDLAGRSVSLARIYEDLRFDQLAINESSKSLAIDSANFSAHRFLSDTFSFQQRVETSRVSELLQAQLLQPININPVQPQSPETGLNILFGTSPSESGFNEFTSLFERDGIQFLGLGAFGNNGTHADQAIISGIYENISYSVGQLHYETEGFRENNELRHNLYNLFFQTALTSDLDIQFEYRRRESNEGDLRLNFEPEEFSKSIDRNIEIDTPRLGIHFSPNPNSHLLLSAIYRDREEILIDPQDRQGQRFQTIVDNRNGYDIQAQYLFRKSIFNTVLGLSTYHFTGNNEISSVANEDGELRFRSKDNRSGRWYDAYLYSSINFPDRFFWTLGFSYVSFKDGQNQLVNFNRVLPKIGLQWEITDNIKLRASAMKTVKRTKLFEETLESTQIAGFSQFFDDFNGTIAQRFGIGVDINFTKSLYGGIELSRRNTDVPRIFERGDLVDDTPEGIRTSIFKFESQREDLLRGYLYWKADANWSVLSEYKLERFRRNPSEHFFEGRGDFTADPTLPTDIWTTQIPLSIRYFNSNGFFASFGATYIHQKVKDAPGIQFEKNNDEFVVVDSSIGFRLPKRLGIISLQIKNLFDEDFRYQDVNFQTAQANTPVFTPDRTILGRILINF